MQAQDKLGNGYNKANNYQHVMKKHRPRPPSPPTPKWFKWGIVAFIAFVFYQGMRPTDEHGNTSFREVFRPLQESLTDTSKYPDILPSFSSPEIKEIKAGDGATILCGQTVTIKYLPFDDDASRGEPQILQFNYGAKDTPAFLNRVLQGMRIGSIWRISTGKPILLSALLETEGDLKETEITAINIELQKAEPDTGSFFATDTLPFRLSDIGVQRGGAAATCGETVSVHIILYDQKGGPQFNSRDGENAAPIAITPGDGGLMAGLEQGIIGMKPGEIRSLILPPVWQRPLREAAQNVPSILTRATDHIVIMDVERVKDVER